MVTCTALPTVHLRMCTSRGLSSLIEVLDETLVFAVVAPLVLSRRNWYDLMGPNLCESTAGFYHVSSMQKHNARAANGDVLKQACPNNPIDVSGESGIYARCTQVLQPLNEYARINCPKLRNCKMLELPPNHGIPPWQSPHSAISFPSVREILSREL